MTVIAKPKKVAASRAPRAEKKEAHAKLAVPVIAESAGRDLLVPLNQLVLGDANVRKVHHEEGILELAALIEAQGLLQRLSVVAMPDGRFAVVAGGRRLRAIQVLAQSGRWTASQPVECKLYEQAQALQVSLAENSGREAMHPADQMEAFKRLIEGEGLTVAQVAGRFGVSPLTVERRLKLARLSPRFLDLYRAGEIEPDQLQALALLESHAAQEAVWEGLSPYDRSAWRIRNAVTAEACSADSRLARFVGLDAYEAKGGTTRRDLFASLDDLSGIYLDNPQLLQTLAIGKLRGVAAGIQAEGWAWVECSLDADMTPWRSYGRADKERREPTAEEAALIEQLSAEQCAHAQAYDRHQEEGDPDAADFELVEQQLCEALDTVEQQLDASNERLWHWPPERIAIAGALVRLDSRGDVVVDRGLVRPRDRKAAAGAGAGQGGYDESAPGDLPSNSRPALSDKLMRDLTAHRTAAVQAALVQNPCIALVTLVHRLAETVFGLYGRGDDIVKVSVRVTGDSTLAQEASDYSQSPAATVLGAAETQWGDRLPGNPDALFRWLLVQSQETLLELLAYCTSRSVNAIVGRPRCYDHSDALAAALGVDMADWWVPTAANYLGRVSKAKALEAVKEATGSDVTQALAGMKKADAAAHCASKLEGTRWLPEPLRRLSPLPCTTDDA